MTSLTFVASRVFYFRFVEPKQSGENLETIGTHRINQEANGVLANAILDRLF